MATLRRRRVWLTVLLAVVVSGLGHAYLRRWGRAFGWYLLITATLVFIVPEAALDRLISGQRPPIADILPAFIVAVASVVDAYVLAVRNNRAYDRAQRAQTEEYLGGDSDPTAGEGVGDDPAGSNGIPTGVARQGMPGKRDAVVEDDGDAPPTISCPHCGREADVEIDFCHWCTEPLPGSEG
ncbi:zinc ribbon domain-containing protein [Halorubrum vacuolatum]|uniref:DUF7575 domain-containing protein n=1 Tax=Halorubrum vacuolatum TaxID=63740 RepID=A0A238WKG5_HALVU|nr:zinc ribbon domain-containing protein [Halorubrum vacuolatum]SNR47050.1 hypothetical protein SAMN06264855_10899 [Halorubrum vacuolatum]